MVRKANLKRKKPIVKPSELASPQLSAASIPPLPISLFAPTKQPKVEAEEAMSGDEDAPPPVLPSSGEGEGGRGGGGGGKERGGEGGKREGEKEGRGRERWRAHKCCMSLCVFPYCPRILLSL